MVAAAGLMVLALVPLAGAADDAAPAALQTTPVAATRLAPGIQTIVAALGARLGGVAAADVERAGRVAGSAAILPEETFRYRGFALKHIDIDRHARHKAEHDRYLLSGVLGWQDAVGRRAASAFSIVYRRQGERSEIEQAAWVPRFADEPVIRSFILPADVAPSLETAMKQGFAAAYMAFRAPTRDVAVVADKTYILGVFILDRQGPDSLFELRLSDDPDGVAGDAGPFRYHVFEPGWAAAVTGVSGRALLAQRPKWVKAVRIVPGEGLFASDTETLLARIQVAVPR